MGDALSVPFIVSCVDVLPANRYFILFYLARGGQLALVPTGLSPFLPL